MTGPNETNGPGTEAVARLERVVEIYEKALLRIAKPAWIFSPVTPTDALIARDALKQGGEQ